MQPSTIHLTILLVDIVVSKMRIKRGTQYQLVGTTCLLIACKLNEMEVSVRIMTIIYSGGSDGWYVVIAVVGT